MKGHDNKICVLDTQKNILRCKEADNSWRSYDVSASMASSDAMHIKDDNIRLMVKVGSDCYSMGKCKDPAVVRVFKLDSCPACKAHLAVVENMVNTFHAARLPVAFEAVDAKDHLKEFKKLKCNGTPCVSMRVGSGKEHKIYEGNRSEIAAMSAILGVPNPLFSKIDGKLPKRLVQ